MLAGARALVVTATEEFGIAAVEAQAAGRPVIALAEGGVRETVREGVTGAFYEHSDVDGLIEAVSSFDPLSVDPSLCIENASRFDRSHFRSGIRAVVADASAEERPGREDPRRPRRVRGLGPGLPIAQG